MHRFRMLILAAVVVLAAVLAPAALAGAQEITDDATAVAPVGALTLSAFTVLVLTSFLIPVLTGLVTKYESSALRKQIWTAAIAAVAGVITTSTQLDGTAVISLATLQYAALSFAIATVAYLGIYKPHDANAKLAPNTGVPILG